MPINDLAVEHRMYLPLAAVIAAVVLGGDLLLGRVLGRFDIGPSRRAVVHGAIAALLVASAAVALGARTWLRNAEYRTDRSIWECTVRQRPLGARAYNNLGNALAAHGEMDGAIAQYRKALALDPDSELAHNNLGLALARRGRAEAAIAEYRAALRSKPDYGEAHNNLGSVLADQGRLAEAVAEYRAALKTRFDYAEANYNLGKALVQLGQVDEAMVQYEIALEINPEYAKAHNNLGKLLAGRGQLDEAIVQYRMALEVEPDLELAHNNLGNALARRGELDEAVAQYRRALEIQPDYGESRFNLSMALAQSGRIREAIDEGNEAVRLMPGQPLAVCFLASLLATHAPAEGGDPTRAIELAQRACALTGRHDATSLDTLAAAHAAAGRFGQAVETATEARRVAEAAGQRRQAESIQSRLELYRQRKPYREAASRPSGR
jgi:tetratricopeptide (TPR) repeat protein